MNNEERPSGGWLMIVLGWSVALLLLTMLFNGYLNERANPNRITVLSKQSGELVLHANNLGHYLAEGYLNGLQVTFLLDTGATQIAVPKSIAARAGLNPGTIVGVQTAAGPANAHNTRIRRINVGQLQFSDMRGVIIPSGDNMVLLGMNALGDLDIIQRDGALILKKPETATL
ncbi:TIGR02281 family clan AA aspartic protease [Candidatus Persebacteraceae bacterium Df01]|jgi:aspartyl protease family protein|uniref:TIGR02281 family clan AA aspartic protease n=1 Tax=Candidatus Doriopsillibacter californiensis TaxID=2970740 RepID=A0ABT7QN22_9GAMM|nr:TIGR02281 family clan AA aspartic protease [Candidatus Persebacteraceae bacterium Df01]